MRLSLEQRFEAKVETVPGGCWEWRAARNRGGYGVFTDAEGKSVLAHRWAYQRYVGPIPDGLQLDHLCCNKGCVNPAHLDPVTQLENRRRARKTRCKRGHELTPENTYKHGKYRRCSACSDGWRNDWRRRKALERNWLPSLSEMEGK